MWEIKVWDPACNLVLLVLMQVELSKTESGIREYLFVSDRLQQMVILLRQEDLVPYQHFPSPILLHIHGAVWMWDKPCKLQSEFPCCSLGIISCYSYRILCYHRDNMYVLHSSIVPRHWRKWSSKRVSAALISTIIYSPCFFALHLSLGSIPV